MPTQSLSRYQRKSQNTGQEGQNTEDTILNLYSQQNLQATLLCISWIAQFQIITRIVAPLRRMTHFEHATKFPITSPMVRTANISNK